MRYQRGISLVATIIVLAILGFMGIMAAKIIPAYLEARTVKKMFRIMSENGLKGTPREIRREFDRLNAIEGVQSIRGDDLEVTKRGQETVLSAAWTARVPLVHNASACLEFAVTSGQ